MYNNETHDLIEAARELRAAYMRDMFRSLFRRPVTAPALSKAAQAA